MFEKLITLIEEHPRYGPALKEAVEARAKLVLNYHTHGDPASYCVAICAAEPNPIQVLGSGEDLRELAHVQGIGTSEDDCLPLMATLGGELSEHYGLERNPLIYLNGEPLRAS